MRAAVVPPIERSARELKVYWAHLNNNARSLKKFYRKSSSHIYTEKYTNRKKPLL